jgi:ribosomal 30S subunit maturation factor RimM
MTRLQEEINQSMIDAQWGMAGEIRLELYSEAAAEIAKKYIEKAWNEAWGQSFIRNNAIAEHVAKENGITLAPKTKEEWMKENGVI